MRHKSYGFGTGQYQIEQVKRSIEDRNIFVDSIRWQEEMNLRRQELDLKRMQLSESFDINKRLDIIDRRLDNVERMLERLLDIKK